MRDYWKKINESELMRHAKHHWLTISFFLGFIVDNLTLNRVDQLFDDLILLFYILLAMVSMLILYAAIAGKWPERWIKNTRQYTPLVIQYAFGGLFSGMLIFYGRSGFWLDSWPFLVIIVAIIYFNETIKDRSGRLVFSLIMFFIGLFAYVVLIIPVILGKMGDLVFVGSGILALFIMYLFLVLLRMVIPNFLAHQMRVIVFSIGSVFVTMNFLYFLSLIPPIPLSLNDIGIYHSVVRFGDGGYQLKYEKGDWWQFWKRSDTVFHPAPGDNVFCFARVFAPTRLSTEIYHRFEYYDESKKEWVTHARIDYPIQGGRSDGYRGYTQIGTLRDGKWRCSVETARGQVLGRERFSIDSSQGPGELETRVD